MPLTPEDIAALQTLIREEVDSAFERRLTPFREEVMGHFDHLYAQNEKREQEYLVINEQLKRIDSQLTVVDTDVKTIKQSVTQHGRDIDTLKRKCA